MGRTVFLLNRSILTSCFLRSKAFLISKARKLLVRPLHIPLFLLIVFSFVNPGCAQAPKSCWTGAFLADTPTLSDIERFQTDFGKKHCLVLFFVDWNHFPEENVLRAIQSKGCVPIITWEPWDAVTKQGIDTKALLAGRQDAYLASFARRLRAFKGPVFLRFAHEMNGDWYPWSGKKQGPERYIAVWRYTKSFLDKQGVANIRWIFSVNWQDVPSEGNRFVSYYPGGAYVDFIGVDGYNWGNVKSGMSWMSFREIFTKRCAETRRLFHKPILVTEFGSTSLGGDKAKWIHDALTEMKKIAGLEGFILFNVDKETDWSFHSGRKESYELKQDLADPFFIDSE